LEFAFCISFFIGWGQWAEVPMAAGVPAFRCTCTSPAIAFSVGGLRFGAAAIRQPVGGGFSN